MLVGPRLRGLHDDQEPTNMGSQATKREPKPKQELVRFVRLLARQAAREYRTSNGSNGDEKLDVEASEPHMATTNP